jgi:hypothetical protein
MTTKTRVSANPLSRPEHAARAKPAGALVNLVGIQARTQGSR